MDIVMPQMGESLAEGTVVTWLKGIGDAVAKDEPLLEIETDKVDTVIDSPADGVLTAITVGDGTTVPVGAVLGRLAVVGEDTTAPTSAAPESEGGAHFGRGDQAEVVAFDRTRRDRSGNRARRRAGRSEPVPPEYRYEPTERDRVVPMSPVRRRTAQHMTWSRRLAAHASAFDLVDVGAVIERIRDEAGPVNFTAAFARAAVMCLADFPHLNAAVVGDDIVLRPYVNLGIAVAVDAELVVPVVADAHRHSVAGLAEAIAELGARARERRLQPADVHNGTFTYSNPGIAGGMFGTPIVHQPQVALLSTNAVRDRPWVVDGAVVARPVVGVSLSFDHRVIDGLMAFQFIEALRNVLETPHRIWEPPAGG